MSPPGTISGSPDPDDRLHAESAGRPPRPAVAWRPDDTPPPPLSPGGATFVFLFVVLVFGTFVVVMLSRPMMELVAWTLTALGQPVRGPFSYPRGGWLRMVLSAPKSLLVFIVGTQLVFATIALAGALGLGGGLRRRLGLVRPRGGWRVLGIAVVLEALTFGFGIAAVMAFLPAGWEPPETNLRWATLLRDAPFTMWLALLAAMSLLPGLCEEALFRGLIQRRLLEGWGPVAAIVVTGFVFTFLHPPFVRALMLLPGCLWLGYVAWRCGSILPGIVLHAGTNAGVTVLGRLLPYDDAALRAGWAPTPLERGLSLAVAVGCAALAAWLLVLVHRWTRVTAPSPA